MAREFSGNGQYLQIGSGVVTALPFTVSLWFNADQDTAMECMFYMWDSGDYGVGIAVAGDGAGDPIRAFGNVQEGYRSADTTSGYSAGSWHHAWATFDASAGMVVLLDGGNKATNGNSLTLPNALDTTTIARWKAVNTYDFDGGVMECAVWNVVLTDVEGTIAAAAYSPFGIRPQSLVSYWSLIRDEDTDRVGGYNLTDYGSPTIASHGRIIYPAPPHIHYAAAAAAAGQPMNLRAATVPGMRQWQPRIGP